MSIKTSSSNSGTKTMDIITQFFMLQAFCTCLLGEGGVPGWRYGGMAFFGSAERLVAVVGIRKYFCIWLYFGHKYGGIIEFC